MPLALDERPFADLVFHVLAHVRSEAPASVYDPAYVAFAARHLGPVDRRALAEDVAILERVAADHARYARLQGLAWLFADLAQFAAAGDRDLDALGPGDVAEQSVLASLQDGMPAAELLRCSLALELEHYVRLPPAPRDGEELARELGLLTAVAPALAEHRVVSVRALGRRGRVAKGEIWVGASWDADGPSLAHRAWQAAHEATVAAVEAYRSPSVIPEREREAIAIAVLAARAERAGSKERHGAWFRHFGGRGGSLDPSRLSPVARDVFAALVAG